MEEGGKPDPRWSEYIEEFNESGKAVGFKLPNNNFLFVYDTEGGWEDEKGNYYNADGVLQPDEENDSIEDDDELSEHEDELVDEFEKLLREEEEGIVRKGSAKKQEEEVKLVTQPKKEKDTLDFGLLLQEYNQSKDRLRQGIPSELFIYFKQRTDYYQKITPEVENKANVDEKKKAVAEIKTKAQETRSGLIASNDWLKQEGVFLDFSGDSEAATYYDRYWYGFIKTTAEKYLGLLEKIRKSEQFKILEIKTYYALRSKLYLKKGQEKIKATIADLRSKIEPVNENQTVSLLIDGLPERFPCSYIYDLVDYAGGKLEDVESVIVEDDFSATITTLKATALLLINLEGYNHDKGQYIEISFCESKESLYPADKHKFYYISVDNEHKIHERQLHDTLALDISKEEVAKQLTKADEEKEHYRFVIGSLPALRRVLMYRGDSLNVVRVLPTPAK